MKKILLAFALFAVAAFAEPSFDQMQDLIGQKQFAAAEQGLEVIIQAHPNSAKAYYSMAQAQAGLGHQDKAQFALNKAKGLDPTLKFATSSNIDALQVAITPQVAKIEKVESGISWIVVLLTTLAFAIIGGIAYVFFKKDKPDDKPYNGHVPPKPIPTPPEDSPSDKAYMQDYGLLNEVEGPAAVSVPAKRGRPAKAKPAASAPQPAAYVRTYTPAPAPAYQAPMHQPTVVNNHYGSSNNSGSDMMTGVLVGSMLSNNNHHDSHTTVIEREVIVERPSRSSYVAPEPAYVAPSRSSTWDDAPAKSSSWNDDSSSKASSSWGSSSSSDSSSSWSSDSSSSSSSSDSSSSWD